MKLYTEAERAALIERINFLHSHANRSGVHVDQRIYEIALAAQKQKPVGSFHISGQQVEATTDYVKDGEWPIDDGELQVYTTPPVAALKLPELGSGVVNEAAWLLHDKLAEDGPLTGHQFNNLKGSFYEDMKVALGAPAEEKK